MNAFEQILQKYRDTSFSERYKGYRFERLMQAFLKTCPLYEGKFSSIWLWDEFPSRKDCGSGDKDLGIDLVAKTKNGVDYGYMVDTGNNDVRSEGQSYGMMIAVQLNRRDVFDHIWRIDGTAADLSEQVVEANGGAAGVIHPLGLAFALAASSMLVDNPSGDYYLQKLCDSKPRSGERRYYDNLLYMFAMLALGGRYEVV